MTTSFDALRHLVRGAVIEPGDAAYDDARRSLFASGEPVAVLRPRSLGDVQAGVHTAVASGLALAVRGGGHGFPGFGTNDGGIVIDLRDLNDVEVVDEDRHLVRVGGGATWGDVATALTPHGLAISSGDTASVGVGGLTLTGGIGWKVRKHGLALDNLVGAQVVLADGRVVTASATSEPDLLWALRGGGGNFGIVTDFVFAAHPTTDVFFGRIAFPVAEAAEVLPGWAAHLRAAPLELTSVVDLSNPAVGGPDAPIEVHVAFDGDDPRLAATAIDPIRRLGTVVDDNVALVPYATTLAAGATPPRGIEFAARSAFVDGGSVPAALAVVADALADRSGQVMSLRSVGGAVSGVAEDATAFAHRRAELLLVTLTAGPPEVVEAATPLLDALWHRLSPHVDGAYANFLSSATEADVAATYPPATHRRLASLKRRYDPANVFAGNHNVRPAEPSNHRRARRPRRPPTRTKEVVG